MSRRSCGIVVVGAGLAGLSAAHRLAEAGIDVQVLEATAVVGGRVRGERLGSGIMVDTGAEFVGRPHRRLRALIASAGLRIQPAGLDRAPLLWRLPGRTHTSWRPPLPMKELMRLGRSWWRLRREALTLDADSPWCSPHVGELDAVSLAQWLATSGVADEGIELSNALIGGFATRDIEHLSAAHAAWWITSAGGLLAALRSGQQHRVVGGAHVLPQWLAARVADRIHLNSSVTSISEHQGGVDIHTDDHRWSADAVIVALPLPALRRITFHPPPPPAPFANALDALSYGHAIKIATTASVTPPARHRAVVGGHPLAIAWRHGRTLAGIATADANLTDLVADLAAAFNLAPQHLASLAVTDWTSEPHIGGSYLTYRPGQLTHHAAALHAVHSARVRYAGADFSSWPNSMEGAVQSGQNIADALIATAGRTWPWHY